MIVYRLTKSKYARDLSGRGAEIGGGRWNSKGRAMLYTSESRALCTTEIAVHTPLGLLPKDYSLVSLEIPDDLLCELDCSKLPDEWFIFPHKHETQVIGDNFLLQMKYLTLKVPSAVVRGDFNYLINPNHPEISELKIISFEPFLFDERLFRK